MKKYSLEIVVFVCGACVMVLELVGSRVFAPYYGTSIFVWTSLIGVILACLSLGYWWGGIIADKNPDTKLFSFLILSSGISVAALALLSDAVLFFFQAWIQVIGLGTALATLLLFGVPTTLLGMVSPFAARLAKPSVHNTGSTIGRLYALSTLGSITGTFLGGFVLLSYWSHVVVLFFIAGILVLVSMLAHRGSVKPMKFAVVAFFILCSFLSKPLVHRVLGGDFIEVNTAYNRVWIYDAFVKETGAPIRTLQVNDDLDSAMFLGSDDLVFEYMKYFHLAAHFAGKMEKGLMIGGAAYSYPKKFLEKFPGATMDVVEIDPALTALAKTHFGLKDDARLMIYHEDGRTFLNKTSKHYDAIFLDVFKSNSIPFQLATREAVQKMHEALNDEGAVLVNIISAVEGEKGQFLRAEYATFAGVFPQVYLFPVQEPDNATQAQNIILVALKSPKRPVLYSRDTELDDYLHHVWIREIKNDVSALTDDYAPTERYAAAALFDIRVKKNNFIIEKILDRMKRGA